MSEHWPSGTLNASYRYVGAFREMQGQSGSVSALLGGISANRGRFNQSAILLQCAVKNHSLDDQGDKLKGTHKQAPP